MKCSIKKYFFSQTELEYLSLLVMREGVYTLNKKVEVDMNMMPPTSKKGVHKFIVLVK